MAAATVIGVGALGLAVSPAAAADVGPDQWGYEQITPATGDSEDIHGIGVSDDFRTAFGATIQMPLPGQPADGRVLVYHYGLPALGSPWPVGPVDYRNGTGLTNAVERIAVDGTRALYRLDGVGRPDGGRLLRVGSDATADDLASSSSAVDATDDLGAVAFRLNGTSSQVYVAQGDEAPIVASVDGTGAPIPTEALGDSRGGINGPVYATNALSADGSSVIFTTSYALTGDNDGTAVDVVRRIVTPGREQTIVVSDANGSGDPDAAAGAAYRWATADHARIFFVTTEGLEPGDIDGRRDLYVRDGSSVPVRVSRGELVDGAPSGNGTVNSADVEWVFSTPDGNRTYFFTRERLTQDAPADGGLYERDLVEGRTRFVAGPLGSSDTGNVMGSLLTITKGHLGLRGIRAIPGGVVFMSDAGLAGAPSDGLKKVFRWTRDGGVTQINVRDADAPPSPAGDATFVPLNLSRSKTGGQINEVDPIKGPRAVTDDGSTVFFTTSESLVAEDTDDGQNDVYRWKEGEGLSLVTPPGESPDEATYLDSSPDGTQVYFATSESVLPGDTDNGALDVYKAILGGGSPAGKPAPDADPVICSGDACQGPATVGVAPPAIGSLGFVGAGNVLAPPAEPRRVTVSVTKPKAVRGTKARLRVRVSERGRVRVSGSGLARSSRSVKKAGTYRVSVRLSKRARRTLEDERLMQ